MEASNQEKRFLIRVEHAWKLWFWPLIAVLYFAWVLFLAIGNYETPGIPLDYWVLGGMGVFAFVVLVELLLLVRRKPKKVKVKKVREESHWTARDGATVPQPAPEAASGYARPAVEVPIPVPAPAPAVARRGPILAVDVRMTDDEFRGRRVIEVSVPPKRDNPGAVYAKSYVPVGGTLVLRVEDLTAEPEDVSG